MLINNIARKTLGLKRHSVKMPERKMVSCWYTWSQISAIGSFVLSAAQYDTLKERRWKHVPLWGIPILLIYKC